MIINLFEKLENILLSVAVAAIFTMMALVSADTVGRYVFGAPLEFQFELTKNYLMVMSVVLALSWGAREGAFIKITAFSQWIPEPVRRFFAVFNSLLAGIVFIGITWNSALQVHDAWEFKEVFFGVIDWPVWAAKIWVPIGCGVLSLRLLIDSYRFGVLKEPLVEASETDHFD